MHQATQASRRVGMKRHAAVAGRASRRAGFTLVEILIVIGIIVLLLGLSVPAFSWLTGSNSTAGAENNISAMVGRARGDALGLQRDTGVFFFIDPASQRVAMAEVFSLGSLGAVEARLELVPDRDFIYLPGGTTCQVIDDYNPAGASAATDDRYIGYNTILQTGLTTLKYGGVILFDANGRLASRTYSFAARKPDGVTVADINNLLMDVARGGTAAAADMQPKINGTIQMRSSFGVAVMEREPFMNNGGDEDGQITGTSDAGEESWIDQNSVPLLINRFNGTLLRSE